MSSEVNFLFEAGTISTPNNESVQQWLDKYRRTVDNLKRQIGPDFLSGQLIHLTLESTQPITISLTEDTGQTTSDQSARLKGADDFGNHFIRIQQTKRAKFAPGVTPPNTEFVMVDQGTNQYIGVESGKILPMPYFVAEGAGSMAGLAIIGTSYKEEGFLPKKRTTTGVFIWINPNIQATYAGEAAPDTQQ